MQAQDSEIESSTDADTCLHSTSVGILFIHGIGNQQRGDTLLHFGEPVIRWINSWLEGSSATGTEVRIIDASLRQADDPVAPAHALLRIRYRDPQVSEEQDRNRHWLMAESNWAETFVPPSYAQVAKWSVQLFPWAVASHFGEQMQRRMRAAEISGQGLAKLARSTGNLVSASLFLALGLCLTPVIVALMLLMLILGLVPISWIRSAVGSFQRMLASVIGDSFTLLDNEIQAAAIVGRVRRDMLWLSKRCNKVALVAHSQGAAIAHEVIRSLSEEGLDPPELLITFGSGLKKLAMLRGIRKSELKWRPYLVLPGLIMSAVTVFDVVVPTIQHWRFVLTMTVASVIVFTIGGVLDKLRGIWKKKKNIVKLEIFSLPFILGIVGAIGCLALILAPSFITNPFSVVAFLIGLAFIYLGIKPILQETNLEPDILALPEQTRWLDFFASADPVSNGALLESGPYSVSWPHYTGDKRVVTESASLLERDDDFLLPNEIDCRNQRDCYKGELMRFAQISNRSSAITDHISYWKNTEEFVGPVACALADLDNLQLDRLCDSDGRLLEVAKYRRRWRLKCLRYIAGFFVALVGLVLIGMWSSIPDSLQHAPQLLVWITSATQSAFSQVPILATMGSSITVKLMFVVLVVCLGAIAYLLSRAIWLLWEWQDAAQYLARKRFEPAPLIVKALLLFGILMANASWLLLVGSTSYFLSAVGMAAIISPIVAGISIRGLLAFSIYIPAFAIALMHIEADQAMSFYNVSTLTLVVATLILFVLWLISDSRVGHILNQRIDGICGAGNVHVAYARLFDVKEQQQRVLSEYLARVEKAIVGVEAVIEDSKATQGFFKKIGAWFTKIDAKGSLFDLNAEKKELDKALGQDSQLITSKAALINKVLLKLSWLIVVTAVMVWGIPYII